MLLGHPIHLKAKAGGDKSMSEKRGPLEDAEGAVPQDPRDETGGGGSLDPPAARLRLLPSGTARRTAARARAQAL